MSGQAGFECREGLGLYQFIIAANLFSLDVGLALKMSNTMGHTLPSSFLFHIII